MTANQLRVQNLTYFPAGQPLFSPLSFEVNTSDALLIEGANGAGKTTLIKLLTGILAATVGQIFWNNQEIHVNKHQYLSALHYIGHQSGLKLGLTVDENLQLIRFLAMRPAFDPKFYTQVLTQLNLHHLRNHLTRHLSQGQRRRVSFAKLFLMQKQLWILDEPLTSLDTAMQMWFIDNLKKHLENGGSAIISSHQLITDTIPWKRIRLTR